MELVVHRDFLDFKRGDVIRGADVADVQSHPIFRGYVSAREPEPTAPAPAPAAARVFAAPAPPAPAES